MRKEVLATAWVCVRDRRVLVVRPHYTDVFYLPGGKPEPGRPTRRRRRGRCARRSASWSIRRI
ncbi:hypothetical protein [Paractinoplanes durhamensis]|uniref:hypothetical protein n=1 Tax=Paractinoplanes durhamensis TaxID=113563 RepID=UPI0036397299